jgi:hypothetical protein
MSETALDTIAREALTQIYDEAEPGLDFEEVWENPDSVDDDWYKKQYLNSKRQQEILHQHFDRNDLTQEEESSLYWTVIVDLGPTGSRKIAQEARESSKA